MSCRNLAIVASLAAAFLIGGMVWAIVSTGNGWRGSSGNPLQQQDDFADKLDLFDSAEAFGGGTLDHARLLPLGRGAAIVLDDSRDRSFRRGAWISPPVQTEFAFTELIPSYNALVPQNCGLRLQLKVRDAGSGKWSPWLYFGRWGRSITAERDDRPISSFAGGKVMVDVLMLDRPADAYQVRAVLQSLNGGDAEMPRLRRVAVVYSGRVENRALRQRLLAPPRYVGRWDRTLAVPFVPQGDAPKPLIGEVCSPTSVTMVASYYGAIRPLAEHALAIYDEETRIFGNWNRAVQRAGELGLDAWITRFRNWEQVRPYIAAGTPVIASIRFDKGAMPSNPIYQDTNGHLIVIKGFTADGDVIVNDPASREKGNGVVYKGAELASAWFGAGGVGYVIRSGTPVLGAPTQPD